MNKPQLQAKDTSRPNTGVKGWFLRFTRYCATSTILIFVTTVVSIISLSSVVPQSAAAATNSTLNFQARILQSSGALVPDGLYNLEFKIYDSLNAGGSAQATCSLDSSTDDCWWLETRTGVNAVRVVNGYVAVNLGSVTPFGTTIPWDQELYVTMRVGGIGTPSWDTEMTNAGNRMKLSSVPYAFRAAVLMNAAGTASFNADNLIQKAPAATQAVNSSTTVIDVDQAGAGALIDLKQAGVSRLTVSNSGLTTLSSGLIVGNTASTTAGAIRWNGSDFEGYNGSSWNSFTQGSGNTAASATITSSVANLAGTATGVNAGILSFTSATAVSSTAGSTTGFVAPSNGSFRACTVIGNANRTAGTASLRWRINGVSAGAAVCVINATTPRTSSSTITSGIVSFNAGDTINVAFDSVGLLPAATTEYSVYWSVEYGTVPNAGSSFVQGGNAFAATGVLGTTDNNALSLVTNGTQKIRVEANGNTGIGTSGTPAALN